MAKSVPEEKFDERAHAALLEELRKLDGKSRKIGREKLVRVTSDFTPSLNVKDILKKIGDEDLSQTSGKLTSLPKPLEKQAAKRLKRAAGYEEVAVNVNRWEGIVNQRRKADQLTFPLEKVDVRVVTSEKNFKPSMQSNLEKEVYALLNGAKLMEEKQGTEKEKEIKRAMSLEEIKQKSREIWRAKLLRDRLERKASLLNKSKSRKYHRILRRERLRRKKDEFENLKNTDPEAALEVLNEIEKCRVRERMSLRHKNSKWLQMQRTRAGQDRMAKDVLKENAEIRNELLEKMNPPQQQKPDYEEILKEQEEAIASGRFDTSNVWVSHLAVPEKEEKEDEGFLKLKRFWEEVHRKKIVELEAQREVKKWEEEQEKKKEKEEEKEETVLSHSEKDDDDLEVNAETEKQTEISDESSVKKPPNEKTKKTISVAMEENTTKKTKEDNCKRKKKTKELSSSKTIKQKKENKVKKTKEAEEDNCKRKKVTELSSSKTIKQKKENKVKKTKEAEEDNCKRKKVTELSSSKTIKQKKENKVKKTKEAEEDNCKRKKVTELSSSKTIKQKKENKVKKTKEAEEDNCKRKKVTELSSSKTIKQKKENKVKKTKEAEEDNCKRKKVTELSSSKTIKQKKENKVKKTKEAEEDNCKRKKVTELSSSKTIKQKKENKVKKTKEAEEDNCKRKKVTELSSSKTIKQKKTKSGAVNEVYIDDMFDKVEQNLAEKVSKKLSEMEESIKISENKEGPRSKHQNKSKNSSEADKSKVNNIYHESNIEFDFTTRNNQSQIEESLTRANTVEDLDNLETPKSNVDKIMFRIEDKETAAEPMEIVNLQDGDITKIKSKKLGTSFPDYSYLKRKLESDSEEEFEDELQDLFDDDKNIKEFRMEKEAQEKKNKSKGIDLYLEGWGRWAGPGIVRSKRKKRKFRLTAPAPPQSRYSTIGNVIYNEKSDVHENIRKIMVSELPYPFTSVKDYEASIRQPVGRKFVPEANHRKLTAPPIVHKMGAVIDPMDEEALLNHHDRRKKKHSKLEEELNAKLHNNNNKYKSKFRKKNNNNKRGKKPLKPLVLRK